MAMQDLDPPGSDPAPPPPWATLVCPFRSTSHMVAQPQPKLQGLAVPGQQQLAIQIIPADLLCLGQSCAIFYSCNPGGVQAPEGAGK